MKMIKKTVKATLALIFLCSAVFAQSLADAKKAIDAEQYQAAKTILKNLIKAKPADAENYFYLGNVYITNDYLDSAKTTFTSGVTADAEFALNYVGLGALDLLSNNKAAANTNFVKAQSLVKKKDDGPALYTGKAYTRAKDYDAALNYLENPSNPKSAQMINPKDAEVLVAIGDAYRDRSDASKNDLSNAFKAYQTATTMNPGLVRAKLELAIIGKRAFAWNDAIADFNTITQANPNYAPAYRELAETYLLWARADPAKDYDAHVQAGVQAYDKYLNLTDKSLESRIRHADFLVYAKDWKQLQSEAAAMSQISGADARVLRYQGLAAYQNKDYKTAESSFDQWISKADPKRIYPAVDYLYRGQAKVNVGIGPPADNAKIQQGLEDLRKAVAADSTNADAVEDIATALRTAKVYDMAGDAYDIATKNPSLQKRALDYFYGGLMNYTHFSVKYSRDTTANREQGKPYLAKADTAFGSFIKASPTTLDGYYYKAKIAKEMDDPKKPTGLFLPAWDKFIGMATAKGDALTATEKGRLLEAYKAISYYYYQKFSAIANDATVSLEDKLALITKAEEVTGKALTVDPNDANSKQFSDYFTQAKTILTAPPTKAAPKAAAGTK
jgi:tetratricopeptide (TPR) repeat protein